MTPPGQGTALRARLLPAGTCRAPGEDCRVSWGRAKKVICFPKKCCRIGFDAASLMISYAIVGLGVTRQGVIPGSSAEHLALEAIELALADSGLPRGAVNSYVFQPGFGENATGVAAARAALAANATLLHATRSICTRASNASLP